MINTSSKFSRISEAFASEFLDNFEKMFLFIVVNDQMTTIWILPEQTPVSREIV